MLKKVVIVGAGPSGLLLAQYLLRRGDNYQVEIYERRSDPRIVAFSKSRTYPISLNERGMYALRQIEGLEAAVKDISLVMNGTIFHQRNGKTRYSPRQNPLFTLDRTNLAIAILEDLTNKYHHRLNIHFDCQCQQVDFATKTLTVINKSEVSEEVFTVHYDFLVGADGAYSAVRESLKLTANFSCEQKYIPTDYKSFFLPNLDANSKINLAADKIHSWMLKDGTVVFLLHQLGKTMSGIIHFPRQQNQVANLATQQEVLNFFQANFPDIGQLMPASEAEAFGNKQPSTVLTVRCQSYHYGDSVLLIGDAAHAVSPSIGQGCNAALEDVLIFDQLLDEYSDNIPQAIAQFTVRRQPDGYALVELGNNAFPLSQGLFIEYLIRDISAKILHKLFPKNFAQPLFYLISETTVPYAEILNLYQGWIAKVKKSNEKFQDLPNNSLNLL
ncbi:FAD-dependent monooxygenase [Nostoc sp. FACHB-87]|uniref:FAD-dependent oxidoreductase n=1 Tax=Nostocales TaxID=1161 RepID=UPI001681D401|nr:MULTISPECIES: NAD(P)/FAD-dependent oxidoreductase [Nostocales]MBD2453579.1 FAD-dependent monooxygenase [Nostoc sp. FACHB-87]MBD2475704.1 FAD-dependent monooxygenase [Anabaena sp. FACHB-83]MBD2490204.1 FAD-dependent monooxygenase [Aulosira sp. FACHB-615]